MRVSEAEISANTLGSVHSKGKERERAANFHSLRDQSREECPSFRCDKAISRSCVHRTRAGKCTLGSRERRECACSAADQVGARGKTGSSNQQVDWNVT